MTSTSQNFLDFSQGIQDHMLNYGEIAFRSMINRSYYGLFHKLKHLFETDPSIQSFNSPSIHQDIINHTKAKFGPKYAKKLEDIRYYRVRADYFLEDNFTATDASSILHKIENFIQELHL